VNVLSDYKFSDTQIADALRDTRGNLSDAARLLTERCGIPCSRAYLKRATTSRPMLVELVADMTQAIVDKAEDNIFNLVEHGDDKASYFILRTLGKDRGYVPKEEVEGKLDASALIEAIQAGRTRARSAQVGEDGVEAGRASQGIAEAVGEATPGGAVMSLRRAP
jgi:hypothetical protein